jgi:hypothetical protein
MRKIVVIALGATLLVCACRPRPMRLKDWARTPLAASLTPSADFARNYTLVLRVRNLGRVPVYVERVSLLQVARRSTRWTTANQPLEKAAHVRWLIWPGGVRTMSFDLRAIEFESVRGDVKAPARTFVDRIPPPDRKFCIAVMNQPLLGMEEENIVYSR